MQYKPYKNCEYTTVVKFTVLIYWYIKYDTSIAHVLTVDMISSIIDDSNKSKKLFKSEIINIV